MCGVPVRGGAADFAALTVVKGAGVEDKRAVHAITRVKDPASTAEGTGGLWGQPVPGISSSKR